MNTQEAIMRLVRIVLVPAAAVACLLASGCASERPEPREELSRARTLVDQADKANAQLYAAADVQRAHDELNSAERNYGAKKYNEARADAESAAVDADVATARASAAAAQRAAAEVTQGNNTLRQETQRDASAAAAQPPPQ
jgi:hypothetical protein